LPLCAHFFNARLLLVERLFWSHSFLLWARLGRAGMLLLLK